MRECVVRCDLDDWLDAERIMSREVCEQEIEVPEKKDSSQGEAAAVGDQ